MDVALCCPTVFLQARIPRGNASRSQWQLRCHTASRLCARCHTASCLVACQVPYMKTVSRSISSSVGFILRGRRPFRKRRCRSKREREPCRTCAARARGFESKTAIAIVVVYSRTTYVSYILNIRVRAHVVRSGISSKRKGKILVLGSFLFANSLHLPP